MSMLDEVWEEVLEGMDERITVDWYDRTIVWNTEHFYVKVDVPENVGVRDRIEVHRVLTEGDAARLNRNRPEDSVSRYQPFETYHGFDTVEEARAAGEVALVDLDGERVGYEESWPRVLVQRVQGKWVPIQDAEYWALRDAYEGRASAGEEA